MIARFLSWFGVSKRRILYEYAKSQLGKPKPGVPDTAPIDVNCVEALNQIGQECFGVPFCNGASTITLFTVLKANKRFKKLANNEVLAGDIIVSPTEGAQHGHCGIVGENSAIMSNRSDTGLWDAYWTISKWFPYYRTKLGLEVYFFRVMY